MRDERSRGVAMGVRSEVGGRVGLWRCGAQERRTGMKSPSKGAGDKATLTERTLLQGDLEATGDCHSQGSGWV